MAGNLVTGTTTLPIAATDRHPGYKLKVASKPVAHGDGVRMRGDLRLRRFKVALQQPGQTGQQGERYDKETCGLLSLECCWPQTSRSLPTPRTFSMS